MKPGVTYAHLARLFQRGSTMGRIAQQYKVARWDVEYAIWAVMARLAKRVRGGVDARHTTARSGSSCEAASQQTKSRRGESASSPVRKRRS